MRPLLFLLVLLTVVPATAQPAANAPHPADAAPIYYVVGRNVRTYDAPGDRRAKGRLDFREDVVSLQAHRDGWHHVRRADGDSVWVDGRSLSNLWLRVAKAERTLYVHEGDRIIRTLPIDLGLSPVGTKTQKAARGDTLNWKTPEGAYFVTEKLPNSTFYKAFLINYPSIPDAQRGYRSGLINRATHDQIVRAAERLQTPPMFTPLGGMIELHGQGTGGKADWTQGCVALRDAHIDWLWDRVHVGTPVRIDP